MGDYERGLGTRMKDLGRNDWLVNSYEASVSRKGPLNSPHTLPYSWSLDGQEKHCLLEPMCVLGSGQWEHVATAGSWGPQGRLSGQIEPVYLCKGPMESVQTQPCNMEIICTLYSDEWVGNDHVRWLSSNKCLLNAFSVPSSNYPPGWLHAGVEWVNKMQMAACLQRLNASWSGKEIVQWDFPCGWSHFSFLPE